jgi:endonuclease G, mitochondrial
MAYLSTTRLFEARDAALEAGFGDPGTRPLLFEGVLPLYIAGLPILPQPAQQVFSDLSRINRVDRLVDGGVPLQIWLENAVRQTTEQGPRQVFESLLDEVAAQAAGEPPVPPSSQIEELNEEIIFEDDTVAYSFLRLGWEAGGSVARMRVPPFRDGQRGGAGGRPDGPHVGTGWLVTEQLVMTNHHVVAARTREELAGVSNDDLRLQGRNATAEFDFDVENVNGTEVKCIDLVAWDATLDYALLRLAETSGRRPLSLAAERPVLAAGERLPVNIIQHPMGDPKRVGLRNNLITHSSERELRYLTDTRKGSSGSPVLDDSWRVVALHRAARRLPVKFQGRTTAVVNVGTPIQAILADIAARHPRVHEEIIGDSAG